MEMGSRRGLFEDARCEFNSSPDTFPKLSCQFSPIRFHTIAIISDIFIERVEPLRKWLYQNEGGKS